MANLFFKRGAKAGLATAPVQDGAIYVTTDEHAMYVDVGEERIRLGDFKEYPSWSDIATLSASRLDRSALYYAVAENILCKYTGDPDGPDGGWVQINAQSSLSGIIRAVVNTTTAVSGDANGTGAGTTVETQYKDKNLTTARTSNVSYVAGNGHISISGSANAQTGAATVTITPESIVESASLSASNDQNMPGDVKLVVTNTKTGTSAQGNAINTSSDSYITLRGSGISISESSGVLTFTNDGGVVRVNNSFDANGEFQTGVVLNTGSTIYSNATSPLVPTIRYGQVTSDAVFANGVAVLDIYTKSEVDTKIATELKAVNAMTFKGAVGQGLGAVSVDLPTSNVSNGDTYIANSDGDFVLGETAYLYTDCKKGDLFIAQGTEGTNGYISGNISWIYVPAGDDIQRTYSFRYDSTSGQIQLVDSTNAIVSSIAAGTDMALTGDNNSKTMTIGHANVTRTNTTGTAQSQTSGNGPFTVSVITGVNTSATGHVTGVETTSITIADEFNQLVSLGVTTSVEQNGDATITIAARDGKTSVSGDLTLRSNSLTFGAAANGVTTIEMQWGSF